MNWQKLQENIGWRMRLIPPVIYLDEHGDEIHGRDVPWIVAVAEDDHLVINASDGSYTYRLAKDHIKNFTSEPDKSIGPMKYGILTLLVQLYAKGNAMWPVTTPQPGVSVPPLIDRAQRARDHFTPELAQVIRTIIYGLDRSVANFSQTSAGQRHCQGDSWLKLIPMLPTLYPHSPAFDDLSNQDGRLLAEFYGAVSEIEHTLNGWVNETNLNEVNPWVYIVSRFEHAVRLGRDAIMKFCPDRDYDAANPASRPMIELIDMALHRAGQIRAVHMRRHGVG